MKLINIKARMITIKELKHGYFATRMSKQPSKNVTETVLKKHKQEAFFMIMPIKYIMVNMNVV